MGPVNPPTEARGPALLTGLGRASIARIRARGRRAVRVLAAEWLAALFAAGAPAAERLTICYSNAADALLPLADAQGYYAKADLDVHMQIHPSGFQSLAAMLARNCMLSAAERVAHERPEQAKVVLAPRSNMSPDEFSYVWDLHDYQVVLDQPLLFVLESMARWQIRRMPPGEAPPLPNFLEFLHPDALRAVRPEAVTVIE